MDIEDQLGNISLKDVSNTETAYNSFQTTGTKKDSTGSELDESSEMREKFMQLVAKARKYTEDGNIAKAIELNEKALAIRFSDKLQRRIEKMKVFLADQEKGEGEGEMKSLGQGFMLHGRMYEKLYVHQKEGVLWMWSLFLLGKGGILADDMGLGKTIQIIAFLAGLFDMNKIKSVMIVVPLSVLPNWLNEFNKWTPGINVMQFHGSSKKEKDRALARVRTRGGVLMTTYGLVITTKETFSERHGQEFVWDYVILDEGHKIKNPTKTSKSIHQIPAKHRLILTGTPVQNNLKELWSLFDYVHQGSLLGTVRTFKMEFESAIIRARERDATAVEKKLGEEMAQTLKSIIKPYFLRRTKAEVSKRNNDMKEDSKELKMPTMTRKNDLVIWLHLTETQQQIYQDFTNLDHVKELLMTKKSPLVALTVLKKICDHPRLLSTRACLQLGLDGDSFTEEDLEQPEAYESAVTQINKIPDDVLIQESGKMQILVNLVDSFKNEGHRTLVFSQSRKLLDIIQKIITNRGHKIARLDGTVTSLTDRDKIVKKFQSDSSISVFLLTVQVGGVGLTITAADRVIIYDPNWNPATDAQAVDRVYRIGQNKNVVVYRLITCGTVEEKIYRRQVFKDSITRQTTGGSKNPYRYFTKMELKELFTLDDPKFSKTQKQLEGLHSNQRETDTALDEHIAFLHTLDIFGISDHDLMFKQTYARDDEEDDVEMITGEEQEQNNARFIEDRIKKAQMLIAVESTGCLPYEERSKGAMKYPPSNNQPGRPKPNPLFTQVTATRSSESANETSDNEVNDQESDKSDCEVIDLSEQDLEDSQHEEEIMTSPRKKTLNSAANSPVKQGTGRRVLRPLTEDEVHQRSPQTTFMARTGEIIAEELLISPEITSPIIRLQKVPGYQKMFKKAASMSSSPINFNLTSPKSHFTAGMLSPFKLLLSPQRGVLNPSDFPSQRSAKASPNKLVSGYPLGATVTPRGDQGIDVLVEETPGSSIQSPSIKSCESIVSSPSHRKNLDISHASRKLSFFVADSDQSFDKSIEDSPCPVVKKKHKHHNLSLVDSPTSAHCDDQSLKASAVTSHDNGTSRVSVSENDEGALIFTDKIQQKSLLLQVNKADGDSDKYGALDINDVYEGSPRKTASNKRRSVCLQKNVVCESPDVEKQHSHDSDEDVDYDVDKVKDESYDDKENVPIFRRVGGRNRIVSDSESEGGSCFEVEDSEEEDKQAQTAQETKEILAGVAGDSWKQDESQHETEGGYEDVEDNEVDAEQNERFQDLIAVARTLYKEKSFQESLLYVEEALSIFFDPALEEMANKIRSKVQN